MKMRIVVDMEVMDSSIHQDSMSDVSPLALCMYECETIRRYVEHLCSRAFWAVLVQP